MGHRSGRVYMTQRRRAHDRRWPGHGTGRAGSRLTGHAPRPHREVWDLLPDAVLIVDDHGTVVRANPAAAALLGRERHMVEGREYWTSCRPSTGT
ncbi:PAS domain-containing protein [Streptomyces sp. NPDC014891]|uniref:PAS domain-containing protein n=1 Tax=Streptomyces sp. NPDC014891 TaxID=3364929 RepID=UPI0036F6FE8C